MKIKTTGRADTLCEIKVQGIPYTLSLVSLDLKHIDKLDLLKKKVITPLMDRIYTEEKKIMDRYAEALKKTKAEEEKEESFISQEDTKKEEVYSTSLEDKNKYLEKLQARVKSLKAWLASKPVALEDVLHSLFNSGVIIVDSETDEKVDSVVKNLSQALTLLCTVYLIYSDAIICIVTEEDNVYQDVVDAASFLQMQ